MDFAESRITDQKGHWGKLAMDFKSDSESKKEKRKRRGKLGYGEPQELPDLSLFSNDRAASQAASFPLIKNQ